MGKEKKKSDGEKCKRAFTVVIAITVVRSVCVGIVAVENESLSAGTTQNVNSAVTDIQECFNGDIPFEIKMPQSKEKLRVPERKRVSAPPDGGEDIPFPIVSQNKKGLRVFSYVQNATRSGLGVINVSQSNESRNIEILEGAQNETSIDNHKIKEKDMTTTNRKIAEDLKPKSDYKVSKAPDSKLTSQPIMSASSLELEEPSSNLTITILNETTASAEWRIHAPGEFAAYIPYEKNRLGENVDSLEKGTQDLFLQDVENINITEGKETLLVTFDLKGDYANGFITGKCQYTYELATYAPISLDALKL